MINPFEDQDSVFMALTNAGGDSSLWPAFLPAPEGWQIVAGPGPRDEILSLIETRGAAPERPAA